MLINTAFSGSVNVAQGAALGGSGVIVGSVANNGLLTPGNSPGTLNIIGNLRLNDTGTLLIEIAGVRPSQFDQIIVGGDAVLGGELQLALLNGFVPRAGQQFPFLISAGGISGSFDTVTSSIGGALDFEFVFEPAESLGEQLFGPGSLFGAGSQLISIRVVPLPYTDFVFTPNQFAIANVLDAERFNNPNGPFAAFTQVWDTLPTDQLPSVIEALIPSQISAVVSTTLSLNQSNAVRFANRMQMLRSSGVQPLWVEEGEGDSEQLWRLDPRRYGLWFEGGGTFSDINGSAGVHGFSIESGIANAGFDYQVGPGLVFGFFAGYQGAESRMDGNGGRIRVTGGGGSFYGLYQHPETGWFLQARAGANANSYDTRRNFNVVGFGLASARGSTDGVEVFSSGTVGWERSVGDWEFTAEAGLRYAWVGIDAFAELGAAPFNVAYRRQTGERLESVLTARVRRPLHVKGRTVIPEVRAGWGHTFLNQDLQTDGLFTSGLGTPFGVKTVATGPAAADVGVGGTLLLSAGVSLALNYDVRLADNYTSHNVTGLLRVAW